MAFTNVGPISATQIGSGIQVVAPGSYTPLANTLPIGYGTILVLMDLSQCTTLVPTITCSVDYSLDGGTNWVFAGSSGLNLATSGYVVTGGVLKDTDGVPVRLTGFMSNVPRRDLARPIRVSFTVAGGSITVGAFLGAW